MPRIDIELTSSRPDGSWTWRAAGARQPKGILDGSLLPGGAKVGEVLRADVEVDVDGMTVTAVLPAKARRVDPARIEVLGPPAREQPEASLRPAGPDERRRAPAGGGRTREGERDRPKGGAPKVRTGPARPPAERPDRRERPDRPEGGRPPQEPRKRAATRPAGPPPPPRARPKRLHPGRAHRDAVVASLPPEERPIAEQVLRGGIPAVRQALEEQNAAARAAGAPEVRADALVALAEAMLPRLRAAEWLDRAEAAIAQGEEVALRDLRALVAGADAAAREEVGRELAARLRETLEERSAKERDTWLAEITQALDDGRVVRALRASARPPEPGVRFPALLAQRLSEAAGEALGPDVAPDRWTAVLEAVASSPIRRTVRPKALPTGAGQELLASVRPMADRVPGLAALVGEPATPGRPAGRGAQKRPSGPPPVPPPRPRPPAGRAGSARGAGERAAALPGPAPPAAAPARAEPEPEAEAASGTDARAEGDQPAAAPARAEPEPEAEAASGTDTRAEGGQPAAAPGPELEGEETTAGHQQPSGSEPPGEPAPVPAGSGDDGDDAVLVKKFG